MGNQRVTSPKGKDGDRESSANSVAQDSASPLVQLQEVLGNRAASDRFRANLDQHQQGKDTPHPLDAALSSIGMNQSVRHKPSFRGLSHDLQANATSGMVVQAKMTVRPAGDRYEQEADRVAAQVVQQMQSPSSVNPSNATQPHAQVKASQREAIQPQSIQSGVSAEGGVAVTPELEASIDRARSGGQPLPNTVREPMEQAMGADFSGVRVHTDGRSDQLNRSIQAQAFTTGQDVFFQQGIYQPASQAGQEVIAHELTHVVQQNEGAKQPIGIFDGSPYTFPLPTSDSTLSKGRAVCSTQSGQRWLQTIRDKIAPVVSQDNHPRLQEAKAEIIKMISQERAKKRAAKQSIEKSLVNELKTAGTNSSKIDVALRKYEKAYLETGWNNSDEEDGLFTKIKKQLEENNLLPKGWSLSRERTQEKDIWFAETNSGGATKFKLAEIWKNEHRFKKFSKVDGVDVYVKKGYDKEGTEYQYVLDKENAGNQDAAYSTSTYVKRYQRRAQTKEDFEALGLKWNDSTQTYTREGGIKVIGPKVSFATGKTYKESTNYNKSLRPTAPGAQKNQEAKLTEAEKIFFKLQLGDDRYISLTSTDKAIYSNSGKEFLQDAKAGGGGEIMVDLTKVERGNIIDVHRKERAMEILGIKNEGQYVSSATIGDAITPIARAARDTWRTREVLLKKLPTTAIVKFRPNRESEWIDI